LLLLLCDLTQAGAMRGRPVHQAEDSAGSFGTAFFVDVEEVRRRHGHEQWKDLPAGRTQMFFLLGCDYGTASRQQQQPQQHDFAFSCPSSS
jgi:hypothetical protein